MKKSPRLEGKKPEIPYKYLEFEAFIKTLKGDTVAHWAQVAEALGISKDTITVWKKHPVAQEAIREGVQRAMEGMKNAGSKDWKMWESKLKMLGVSPINKEDITTGGEKLNIGVVSYDDAAHE